MLYINNILLCLFLTLVTASSRPQGATPGVSTSSSATPPPPASTVSASSTTSTSSSISSASVAATLLANPLSPENLKSKVSAADRAKMLFTENLQVLTNAELLNDRLYYDFGLTAVWNNASLENAGTKSTASVSTFPLLVEMGLSATLISYGPCGLNTPHVHPRGNEMLYLISGNLTTGMILENNLIPWNTHGAGEIRSTMTFQQLTIFPAGSVHYQFNHGCAPALALAVFNHEDAGSNSAAQALFGLNADVLEATFQNDMLKAAGMNGIKEKLTDHKMMQVRSCVDKCRSNKPQ